MGKGKGHNLRDLTGKTLGSWLVKRRNGVHKSSKCALWFCRCVCGKEDNIPSFTLLRKQPEKLSCGCTKTIRWRKRPYESLFNYFVFQARRKGIVVDITFDQFLEFTKYTSCIYCESVVVWDGFNNGKKTHATNLDRRDNSKGYSKENVVVCCPSCNYGKGARYAFEEWKCMMNALTQFRKVNNADV